MCTLPNASDDALATVVAQLDTLVARVGVLEGHLAELQDVHVASTDRTLDTLASQVGVLDKMAVALQSFSERIEQCERYINGKRQRY